MNKILGDVMSWLAMLNRRFWPPLMPLRIGVPTKALAWFCRPKAAMSACTRSRRSVFDTDVGKASFAAKSMVSATVKDPINTSSCSTKELMWRICEDVPS